MCQNASLCVTALYINHNISIIVKTTIYYHTIGPAEKLITKKHSYKTSQVNHLLFTFWLVLNIIFLLATDALTNNNTEKDCHLHHVFHTLK